MASLREIRRRIKSVQNINNITRAMELISAVRYRKIHVRFSNSIPFFDSLKRLMSRIVSEERVAQHPLFKKRPLRRELLLVITGDRGLCGGFNASLLKELQKYMAGANQRQIILYPIGKVGERFIRRRGWEIHQTWPDIGYKFTTESLKDRVQELVRLYLNEEFDQINILCTTMPSFGVQRQEFERFLDLSYLLDMREEHERGLEYIFEPEPKDVLESLTDLFVKQRFYTLLLGSVTAEYLARMIAMKQASDNGRELVDTLTLERNKVRQAMITQEIGEIIGGVEALK